MGNCVTLSDTNGNEETRRELDEVLSSNSEVPPRIGIEQVTNRVSVGLTPAGRNITASRNSVLADQALMLVPDEGTWLTVPSLDTRSFVTRKFSPLIIRMLTRSGTGTKLASASTSTTTTWATT